MELNVLDWESVFAHDGLLGQKVTVLVQRKSPPHMSTLSSVFPRVNKIPGQIPNIVLMGGGPAIGPMGLSMGPMDSHIVLGDKDV